MTPLKRYKTKFWGQEYTCRPMLLDHVFGDGKEWVWVQHMDDRPDYYVARCPTGTHAQIQFSKEHWYELLREIEDQIEEEAMDFYSDRAWRERDRNGYVSTNRRWPIPPHMPAGTAWGEYKNENVSK